MADEAAKAESMFVFASNESKIRTYECTALPRFFSDPVIGYLSVTNKRVVYHSKSKALNGESILISEVPLADISGISSWISTSFNWIKFLIFSAAAYYLTVFAKTVLPQFITGWAIVILLMVPYLVWWLFDRNILNDQIRNQFIQNMQPILDNTFVKSKDPSFFFSIFRVLFLIGSALFAWNFLYEFLYGAFPDWLGLLLIYFLIYRAVFGNSRLFGLQISSKAAKGSGIIIPGNASFSLWRGDNAAAQTLNSGPAKDATILIRELGALVLDIQQLGDLGIKKWIKK